MASIVTSAFSQTCQAFPELNHELLKRAIIELNSQYAREKRSQNVVCFTKIRNKILLDNGPMDLFEFQYYKQAIAKYYALRKTGKIAGRHPTGEILEAGANEVLIVVNPEVNILFEGIHPKEKLSFDHIVVSERFSTNGKGATVSDEEFHIAKVKALAVMNSHRGF